MGPKKSYTIRKRQTITNETDKVLCDIWERNKHPNRIERNEIASLLGLSGVTIQAWFAEKNAPPEAEQNRNQPKNLPGINTNQLEILIQSFKGHPSTDLKICNEVGIKTGLSKELVRKWVNLNREYLSQDETQGDDPPELFEMYEGIDTEITRNLNETDLKIIDNIMNDPNGSSIQAPSESPRNVASPGPVYDPYQQPSTSKGPMLGEPNLPKTLHHPLLENSPTPYENIEQVNQPGGTSGYIMDLPEIGNPLHGIPDQDLPVLNADDINNFLSHVQEDNRTNQKAEISSCPQHVLPEKRKSRISIVLENPEDKSQQRIVIPSSVKAIGLKQGAVLSISPKPVARTSQTTPAEPGTSRQAISASQQCVCQQAAGDQGTFKVHVKADSSKIKVPTSLNFNENGPVFTADIEEQLNRLMTKSRTVAQINKAAYEMNIKPIDAWTWYVKTNLIGLEKAID